MLLQRGAHVGDISLGLVKELLVKVDLFFERLSEQSLVENVLVETILRGIGEPESEQHELVVLGGKSLGDAFLLRILGIGGGISRSRGDIGNRKLDSRLGRLGCLRSLDGLDLLLDIGDVNERHIGNSKSLLWVISAFKTKRKREFNFVDF